MKKLLPILTFFVATLSHAQTAKVQVIHNSADVAAATIDIYVDGNLFLDNFKFRTATPFIDVRAGSLINVAIAPGNSTSVADAIVSTSYTLIDGATYVAVASGNVSTSGYEPARAFDFIAYNPGREAASATSVTDVIVYHGSTDAPGVDLAITGSVDSYMVDNLRFGKFSGYLGLPTDDYILEVKNEAGTSTIAAYQMPLSTLNLGGQAITAMASGFFTPENNSNGAGFGIWVSTAAGGDLIELPVAPLSVKKSDLNTFKLYPNPVSHSLTLEGLNLENMSVNIADIQGRLLNANSYKFLSTDTVDVSNLSNGLYHMIIKDDQNNTSVRKFIKK